MVIKVSEPGGSTVQFPNGTDHATINDVMTKHFGGGGAPAAPAAAPMPTFEMTGPDGGTYHVTAPDEHAAVAAFSAFHGLKTSPAADPGFDRNDPRFTDMTQSSAVRGVPILGAAEPYVSAALNTIAHPITGVGHADFATNLAEHQAANRTFDQEQPVASGIAKTVGGALSMAPAIAAAPTLLGTTGSLGARVLNGGVSNAVIGGADSLARGGNPITGAVVGGTVGAAGPLAGVAAKVVKGATWDPIVNNLSAWHNPERFAQGQVARGISESGLTPQELAQRVQQAGQEGQDVYTLGDAMGNAGQRMLSTVARAPGEGRTAVVEAMEARQAGQGRRVINALQEGFGNPRTAEQTVSNLTAAQKAAADAEYGAVRTDAGPVDVTGAISHIDRTLGPAADQMLANGGSAAANDSVESALQGFRARLSRVNPDDFAGIQRLRGDMADAAKNAMQSGYGNKARLIGGAVRQLDAAMEAASPGHAAANANFAQASRNIDAVGQGTIDSNGGRIEDTIPRFQALTPEGQQAYRAGYVDPRIKEAQGAAFGADKSRPLINDAFQAESNAMAPRGQIVNGQVIPGMDVNAAGPMMQRRIGREQTMFQTRQTALGGSATAQNLNDHAAMGVDPHLVGAVGHILSGNIGGAVGSLGKLMANGWSGNTPQVRQQVAQILLQRAPQMNARALEQMTTQTIARLQAAQTTARRLGRGATGALVPQMNQK